MPQPGLRGNKPGNDPAALNNLVSLHNMGQLRFPFRSRSFPRSWIPVLKLFPRNSQCSDETGSGFLVPHVTPLQCRRFPSPLGE